ncbi:MAG: ATP-binding protein [Campylobacter hominis]|uniref:sensor histidine kinase n=1 Tax=Campylobacter TaxID=194 RepID=UPI0023F12BCB|nr:MULTISPECIES: ATP-binding protein [Campylobacter]MCI6642456.1 HAMP domain-containing histidine kinase [Campylobacter sp.]MDD7423072.1 ATP-binding protein [Campylobacter hominis]
MVIGANFKFYLLLFVMGIVYFIITIISFDKIASRISALGSEFTNLIGIEVSSSISDQLNSQTKKIEKRSLFLQNNIDIIKNKDKLLHYLKTSYENETVFDMFQFYTKGDELIYTSIGKNYKIKNKNIDLLEWFSKTQSKKTITISAVEKHGILNKKVINICTPVDEISVFCGIIDANEIFGKIINHRNIDIEYLFLIDRLGDVSGSEIPFDIKSNFLRLKNINEGNFSIGNISFFKINNLDWYVGVGIDKNKITYDSFVVLVKNANLIFLGFALLTIFGNLIYTNIINKLQKKQKEYDVLMQNQLKLTETGELVADISHQLKEPLNAISLVLSSIAFLKKENKLTNEELDENINLSLKSVNLMSDTIKTIRNFYRYSDDIIEFNIKNSIENLLKILSVNLKSKNVNVILDCNNDIIIKNKETYLHQILLILLQNARDALLEKYKNSPKNRVITISVTEFNKFVSVVVSDTGGGISKKLSQMIFSNLSVSSKKDGSGIGLYFAKKMAIDKLGGDLILLNLKDPTAFELKIKKEAQSAQI